MLRPLLLALTLSLSTAASGATAVEANRAQAAAARAKVNELRARQMSLRQELNQLASEIESLKAREAGALIPGGQLDGSLKRSQELSSLLTDAAQQLSGAEGQAERENLALLSALSEGLNQLKAQWDRGPDRAQRRSILTQMKALRQEREQLRAALPAQAVPALEATRSDDPADLLEQADALRDAEDKVRSRMHALLGRISELREEKELDRRMGDFLGEAAIFDEHDRRLRTSREADSIQNAPGGPPNPLTGGPGTPPRSTGPGGGATTDTGALPSAHAQDGRPEVGVNALADPEDLLGLEKKVKELDQAAHALNQRAQDAEARARQLQ